jgi:hypothetical protein
MTVKLENAHLSLYHHNTHNMQHEMGNLRVPVSIKKWCNLRPKLKVEEQQEQSKKTIDMRYEAKCINN